MPLLAKLDANAALNQWLRAHETTPKLKDRFELYDFTHKTYIGQQPIDYLEFGVYKGQSFAHWVNRNQHPNSTFYGFDTFNGLPEDWGSDIRKGHFNTHGEVPAIADRRARFIKGLFQDTLPKFLADFAATNRIVVHNDSDLYSSTLYTLATLNPILPQGTIVIFDEFCSPLHEFRAWCDFTNAFCRSAHPIAMAGCYGEHTAFMLD